MANRPHPSTYSYLFERALAEEIGIGFVIGGIAREGFRTELYKCRKEVADPRYADLIIFAPNAPHDNELWICRKAVELDV